MEEYQYQHQQTSGVGDTFCRNPHLCIELSVEQVLADYSVLNDEAVERALLGRGVGSTSFIRLPSLLQPLI